MQQGSAARVGVCCMEGGGGQQGSDDVCLKGGMFFCLFVCSIVFPKENLY